MTVKARAEAQAGVQIEHVERLKRVESDLAAARGAEATAREEAAQWRGQAEALQAQHAQLMKVLKKGACERTAGLEGREGVGTNSLGLP
jgi:hypothetical protein